jgi:hypothetical protein
MIAPVEMRHKFAIAYVENQQKPAAGERVG